MNDEPEELPDATNRAGGESDVVAERSGATTPMARRPIPADPPEAQDGAGSGDADDGKNTDRADASEAGTDRADASEADTDGPDEDAGRADAPEAGADGPDEDTEEERAESEPTA